MSEHLGHAGECTVEFAIDTPKGVKVPDVAWLSDERWQQIPEDAEASPVAPEICIEVLSASNTEAEMDEKRRLYFERGALEVWTCGTNGQMHFYDRSGARKASELVPSFPAEIEV